MLGGEGMEKAEVEKTAMEKTVIETLAGFAAGLQFEYLPVKVRERANDCLFDLIGCYYGALGREKNVRLLEKIAGFNRMPESVLWGTNLSCGTAEAALGIGTLCYDLEYDDGISMSGHWGSASIPATFLSVAEHGGDGKDLLAGIVAAYETGSRISRLFSPELLRRHVHFPCTMGAFGAITGYAKGAGFDSRQLAGALSLAGLFPVGTYSTAISGAAGKGLYSGWPNYLGVNCARLAEAGLTGDVDILESRDGFGTAVGLDPVKEEAAAYAVKKLGEEYRFMEVYFKPYPCCRWLHAPIHGALRLMKKYGISAKDVEEVRIGGPEFAMMYDTHKGYESKVACQYSIPYTVGAALLYGKVTTEEFEEEIRVGAPMKEISGRITMVIDEELQRNFPGTFSVNMELYTKDGNCYRCSETTPWGPDCPPAREELIEKFRVLTKQVLSEAEVEQWISLYQDGVESDGGFLRAINLLKGAG